MRSFDKGREAATGKLSDEEMNARCIKGHGRERSRPLPIAFILERAEKPVRLGADALVASLKRLHNEGRATTPDGPCMQASCTYIKCPLSIDCHSELVTPMHAGNGTGVEAARF